MRTTRAVVLWVACAGCAGLGWKHPTKPQSELPRDEYECELESVAAYPPVFDREQKDLNELNRWSMQKSCLRARGWQ